MALKQGEWTDETTVEFLKKNIIKWSIHPDAFFANIYLEVIGWKED